MMTRAAVGRVAVLYTELAAYTLACLRALQAHGVEVMLVHWPVNPEAPFSFNLNFCHTVRDRNTLKPGELEALLHQFQPNLVLCSGWVDKGYTRAARKWAGRIPVVLSMDNHWTGGWKQQLWRLAAPITLRRTFSHAFVPGEAQRQYAMKLGFAIEHIRTGFYSADVSVFEPVYHRIANRTEIPKRFLYVGRYVRHKGIFDLWEAFNTFRTNHPDWELWCAGTGDCYEQRVEAPGIRHFGFLQPQELEPLIESCTAYILPSHFEPWGVSVHEMAAAGMPLILSDRIGAAEAFLQDGVTGEHFQAGHVASLVEAMERMAHRTESELREMAAACHQAGMRITPDSWAKTLLEWVRL